jgi:hypothetical protein
MEKIRNNPSEIQVPILPPPEETPENPKGENLKKFFRDVPDLTDQTTDFHRGSRSGGVGHALVAWSFMAALIDALILFAVACAFLFSFSLLVKVRILEASQILDGAFFQVGLAAVLSLVGTYMIMLRVFLGFSIGEWACGLRLGSLKQRLNKFYSLKVLARMILIFATGFFLMPVLSLIFGRDLPGLIVRLPLVSLEKKK